MIEPLVPPECDLRDYPYTPLFRSRLFGSSFHARATDAEWRAGVTLWLKSWDQVPAGSLPTNKIDLCRLAELGRDLRAWRRVEAIALHGWIEATDGRLYHPVVALGVLEAWNRRRAAIARGMAGASKRYGRSIVQLQTEHRATIASEVKGKVFNREVIQTSTEVPSDDDRENRKNALGNKAKNNGQGQNWNDEGWVNATGATLGKQRQPAESFAEFKDRVYGALDAKLRDAR